MSNLIRKEAGGNALAVQEQVGQYLTFLVGSESFAISILDVKEIIEIANVTPVPLTPDYIHGVINLRGNVVPVIDLSARLKHRCAEVSKRSCIVLVEVDALEGAQLIGMLVDEVREILEIPPANIQPAPDFGSDIRTDFIRAMARVGDVFIILLAIDRVLSLAELSQLHSLAHEQESLTS
ncbi:purine-binding chemotaxis protein CheW [Methylomonas sp. LL1]|uniref:chemotaxis protein CheW n=1 Tax=Methylomonas sp. LL1 TaxID=2785785 RepID=UPI0018C4276C|nr:chemotaxis protein CheW [Methylomonas sp. LL1]QPK63912.1 purine-binding chemotaxis protein CheW [Methylomonas sp. LL1]